MKLSFQHDIPSFSGNFIIPVFETGPNHLVPTEFYGVSVPSKVFYGKANDIYAIEKYDNVHLFIGLGKTPDYKSVVTMFRRAAYKYPELFNKPVLTDLPNGLEPQLVSAIVSGLKLGTYKIGHFKNEKPHPIHNADFSLTINNYKSDEAFLQKALLMADAQLQCMQWVDLPPNVVTPEYMAIAGSDLANDSTLKASVFDKAALHELGMGALLAVGQGSKNDARLLVLELNPEAEGKHYALVGKGVTFDTGGLNIKTAGMQFMKSDMAGAAAVVATMQYLAKSDCKKRVTAVVPLCENAVDATSLKPSAVIEAFNKKTIEIIDTDAEGRLILADALAYLIAKHKPDVIVDIATLTGSSVATFGYECGALFTNNVDVELALRSAGNLVGEKLWPLPLWSAYDPDISSDIADVRNYSGKPIAGAITAAKFLEYFTDKHEAWAHLDVAGVAFGDSEFAKSKHATAFGVNLLSTFIENH